MAFSTDVKMSSELEPVFPNRCVVCEHETDRRSSIVVDTQNPLTSFLTPLLWLLFKWKRVSFPLCEECNVRYYAQRWGRGLAIWFVVIFAVYFAFPYFKDWNRMTAKLAIVGFGLLAVVPNIFLDVFFCRYFDVTANSKIAEYEFKSEAYAYVFLSENVEQYPDEPIEID